MLSCGFRSFQEILWSGEVLPLPYLNNDLFVNPCPEVNGVYKKLLEDHCVDGKFYETTSLYKYQKVRFTPNNKHFFKVKGPSDAHILICSQDLIGPNMQLNTVQYPCFEITLGGFSNTRSMIRNGNGGNVLYTRDSIDDINANSFIEYLIDLSSSDLVVYKEGDPIMGVTDWVNFVPAAVDIGVSGVPSQLGVQQYYF